MLDIPSASNDVEGDIFQADAFVMNFKGSLVLGLRQTPTSGVMLRVKDDDFQVAIVDNNEFTAAWSVNPAKIAEVIRTLLVADHAD